MKNKNKGCIVALLLFIAFVIFMSWPAFTPKTSSIIKRDMSNLKQIGLSCKIYAMDFGGEYPKDFTGLIGYASIPKLYTSWHDSDNIGAMSNVMEWTSFVYIPGITTGSPPNSVLAYLPPGHYKDRNGGIILFADGSVEWHKTKELTRILNQSPRK